MLATRSTTIRRGRSLPARLPRPPRDWRSCIRGPALEAGQRGVPSHSTFQLHQAQASPTVQSRTGRECTDCRAKIGGTAILILIPSRTLSLSLNPTAATLIAPPATRFLPPPHRHTPESVSHTMIAVPHTYTCTLPHDLSRCSRPTLTPRPRRAEREEACPRCSTRPCHRPLRRRASPCRIHLCQTPRRRMARRQAMPTSRHRSVLRPQGKAQRRVNLKGPRRAPSLARP